MNPWQEVWWKQARSDFDTLKILRDHSAAPCQQLHYWQMTTEKLAKAYFWGSGTPPGLSHGGFSKFVRSLTSTTRDRQKKILSVFAFKNADAMQAWARRITPLAHQLEHLAPTLARDGPNPEYPWPHAAPTECPADFDFPIWRTLMNASEGRQMLNFLRVAVSRFPEYA